MAGKLPGRAISNSATITVAAITVGNAVVNSSIIALGNSTVNTYINSTSVSTALSVNVGSNVFVNTSTIHLGNSTVNTVIHTTGFTGNGAGLHGINADSIATGTLDTARLPATVNVSSAINVGANLNINTSTIFIGNSTVNTTIIAGNVNLQGTELRVGNVVVNGNQLSVGNVTITDAQISVGNSTVNTVLGSTGSLSGNGSQLSSVNAIALQGNTVSDILTSANTAANTLASNAFTNAASRADSAYSNAVAYANTTFLPLAGGTMTGSLTVNATANIVANLSANNVTFRGDVQIDGNLVVSGTSVTLNVASFAVEDNILHLNNGSTETHPDLGLAGNYNDGTYKHAGIFRDATDGVWKVFDGYTPEPNTAFIDTSNASFRIAHFTANVITGASFSGNGASITSVDAATVGGNTASTLRTYSDTVAATAFSNAALRADAAYSNAIAYSGNAALAFSNAAARADAAYTNATSYASNASNISSGTLDTARLPATVNVSTLINVGSNLNINTSSVQIGNSTANIVFSQSTVTINGVSHSFESIVNTATGANSVMIRNTAGDSAVGSRFHFTSAVADGGTFGIIGLNWGGAANTFKNFEVYDYVNGRPMFRSYGETRNFEIFGTANAAALILTTNTATFGTAAYVLANGIVSIGNSSPASNGYDTSNNKLVVEGQTLIRGALEVGVRSFSNPYNYGRFIQCAGTETQYYMYHLAGYSHIYSSYGSFGITNRANQDGYNTDTTILYHSGAVANQSNTYTSLHNNKLTIRDSGNVGIGTTTPGYKLTVDSGAIFAGRPISDTGTLSFGNTAAVFSSLGVDHTAARTNVLRLMRDGTSGVVYVGFVDFDISRWEASDVNSRTALHMKLGHGNLGLSETTDVMTLLSSGNVGLGNSAPTAQGLTITQGGSDRRVLLELNRPNNPGLQTAIEFTVGSSIMVGRIQHEYEGSNLNHMSFSLRAVGGSNFEILRLKNDGSVIPGADNSYNLGSSSNRWANIYTADLNMSNKGSQNDIDGTWGEWTIQEGEADLFLLNRRNGKKYKFMLKEIE